MSDPKWGDELSTIPLEGQEQLRALAEQQRLWAEQPKSKRSIEDSVFKNLRLNGIEVFFLAALTLAGSQHEQEDLRRDIAFAKQIAALPPDERKQYSDFEMGLEVAFALARSTAGAESELETAARWLRETDRQARKTSGLISVKPSLSELHLELANLSGAFLEGAHLPDAHLQGTNLAGAHLDGANLTRANLEGADLSIAKFNRAILFGTNLSNVRSHSAEFKNANLTYVHLESGQLWWAAFQGANFDKADLFGADLMGSHFEGANLNDAKLDNKTVLNEVTFDRKTRLGDIQWGGVGTVNLSEIEWDRLPTLGDEVGMRQLSDTKGHERAVRAYRQLSAQLRAQGIFEPADRFAYRAQVLQRGILLRRVLADWKRPWRLVFDIGRYLGSGILALIAGYGYRPGRSLFWYLVTIIGFAILYMQATQGWVPFGLPAPSQLSALPWYEALILSVSSFHGRGFFQPLESLGDPIAALAAIEAVIGLLIEVSLIATFTQRFFGTR